MAPNQGGGLEVYSALGYALSIDIPGTNGYIGPRLDGENSRARSSSVPGPTTTIGRSVRNQYAGAISRDIDSFTEPRPALGRPVLAAGPGPSTRGESAHTGSEITNELDRLERGRGRGHGLRRDPLRQKAPPGTGRRHRPGDDQQAGQIQHHVPGHRRRDVPSLL